MNAARFQKLAGQLLDHEISPRDLDALRKALECPERRKDFERLKRIHAAEKAAMSLLFGDRPLKRSLTNRAAHAFSEARLRFEERRKGLVLLGQFSAVTAAIALTVSFLYRGSINALAVEDQPETSRFASGGAGMDVRQRLQQELRRPIAGTRLLVDQRGRAVAMLSVDEAGATRIEPIQTVSEGSLLGLAKALESAKPTLPSPSELLDEQSVAGQSPVQCLPGTSAPVTLVIERTPTGAVVGYAY